MDSCCQYDYAGISINDTTPGTDRLVLDEEDGVVGLDGAPIRAQIDPKGQSNGGIVHTKRYGPRIIVFKGFVDIRTVENRQTAEYRQALNQLEAFVISALEAHLNSPTTLTWTPEGLTTHSISASYGNEGGHIQFGGSMIDRTFTFTLVAADPTITVA